MFNQSRLLRPVAALLLGLILCPLAACSGDPVDDSLVGTWSLKSDTWGDDGGTYEIANADTMRCVGKLSPGTWVRTSNRPTERAAQVQQMLTSQPDGSRLLARDLPEFMHTATQRARLWKQDAIPVSIKYNYQKNRNYTGPQVQASFNSPSEGTGFSLTAVGDVINTGARLQSRAQEFEIVLSECVYAAVADKEPEAKPAAFELKGKAGPVGACVIPAIV